jgi:hypothetical protein
LSPDGKWLAVAVGDSGPLQIYMSTFPSAGPAQQVTVDGGREPKWSRDGRELFFRHGPRMFAVRVDTTHGLNTGTPIAMFEGPYVMDGFDTGAFNYDVSPDGRFLMIKPSPEEAAPPRLNVVINWLDELTRRVPAGRR